MKSHKSIDSRIVQQVLLLGLLTVLPIVMIGFSGAAAVRSLFAGPPDVEQHSVAPATNVEASLQSRPREYLRFGVYDPAEVFSDESDFAIRHVYVSWLSFDADELAERLTSLAEQRVQPFITIEPWPMEGEKKGELLRRVASGDYDRIIDRFAGTLRGLTSPLYLCWGHEMDQDLAERYPWSGGDPTEFVAAYRYFVNRLRSQVTTELHWVWAGVLKEGSLRYWPGNEYVDYVGMPIYSFPDWDRRTYGYIRDFRTTFDEKRKIVAELRKPLIITELGASGSEDFESFWMHQAFVAMEECVDLKAVMFFYSADTESAWGSDVSTPDWRVHPDLIRSLVAWKLR